MSYPHKASFVKHSPDPKLFLHQLDRGFSHANMESESAEGLDSKEREGRAQKHQLGEPSHPKIDHLRGDH